MIVREIHARSEFDWKCVKRILGYNQSKALNRSVILRLPDFFQAKYA